MKKSLVTKFLGIVFVFFLWQAPSYSSNKIYCMTVSSTSSYSLDTESIRYYTVYELKKPKPLSTCEDSKSQWNRYELTEVSKEFYENGPFIGNSIPKKILVEDFEKVKKKYGLDKAVARARGFQKCSGYLDWSWNLSSNIATMKMTNNSNRPMEISGVEFYTAGGIRVTTSKTDIYIKPFAKLTRRISLEDFNTDVIKSAAIFCDVLSKEKKNVNKSSRPKDNNSITIIALIIALGFIGFVGYTWRTSQNPKKGNIERKEDKVIQQPTANPFQSNKVIERVWNGDETMAKTFWLFNIIIGLLVSLICGVLAGLFSNIFILIALIYFVWCNVGLWNSSTKYKNFQLKNQKPYGWSIAAKIWVVLTLFTVFGQTILMFTGGNI